MSNGRAQVYNAAELMGRIAGDLAEVSQEALERFYLTSCWGVTRTIGEWVKANEVDPIHALLGHWAVTDYGLGCLTNYYPIEARRLWEGEPSYCWEQHMSQKRWVNLADFRNAIAAAREYHASRI